jgi:MFS family permease
VLTFLPAGFAFAATVAGALLPAAWTNRARCLAGAAITAVAMAAGCAGSAGPVALATILAVAGFGLGIFTPANNAQVMAAIPAASSGTGGGMVNLARGLGTSLGITLVTLCLQIGPSGAGRARWAFAALLAAALAGMTTAAVSQTRRPGEKDPLGISEGAGTG